MKSQTRTVVMMVVILLLWRFIYATPFLYFADMISDGLNMLFQITGLPLAVTVLLKYSIMGGLTCLFLFLGRKKFRLYLAGFFSLAVLIHHLIICIKNNQLYDVSLPIAAVLALALLFLLIKNKTPGLFLSDAFIVALPVWLLYDSFLFLLFSWSDFTAKILNVFFAGYKYQDIMHLDSFLNIPWQVWVIFPSVCAILPIVFLSKNRAK